MRSFVSILFMMLLQACASGSAVIVGQTRPPIEDFESVVITNEMPVGAETISLVNATSDAGWNKQQSIDYVIWELKKQADKVGANTVVIGAPTTESTIIGIPSYGSATGTLIVPVESESIQGTAVFVEQ